MEDNFRLSEEELGVVRGIVKVKYETSSAYPVKEKDIIELVKKEIPNKFSDKNPRLITPLDILNATNSILEQYKEFLSGQLENEEESNLEERVTKEPQSQKGSPTIIVLEEAKELGASSVGEYGKPESESDGPPTPTDLFGDKKHPDYMNVNDIGNFLEQTLNQIVPDQKEREEIGKYLEGVKITDDISNSPRFIGHIEGKHKYFDPEKVASFIKNFIQNYRDCIDKKVELPNSTKDIIEIKKREQLQDAIIARYERVGMVPDGNRVGDLVKKVEEAAEVMKRETITPGLINKVIGDYILDDVEKKIKELDKEKKEINVPSEVKKEENLAPETDFKVDINAETQELEPIENVPRISRKTGKKHSLFSYFLGFTSLALAATALYSSQIAKKSVEETKRISNDSIAAMQRIDENISKLYVPKDIQQKINDSQNTTIGKIDSKVNTFQKDINDSMNSLRGEVTTTEQSINDRNKKLEDRLVKSEEGIKREILYINKILTELKDANSSNTKTIEENRIEYNNLLLSFKALTESIAREKADYEAQKEELELVKATLEDLSDKLEEQPKVVQKEVKEEPKKEKRKPVSEPEISEESRKRFDEWQRSKYEK